MKKLLLALLLAGSSFAAFAQLPTFGIKGGINSATLSSSGTANNVVPGTNLYASSGSITSFNAGVFVDFKLGHWSLQPAVNFTGKGGTFHGVTGQLPDGSTTVVDTRYHLYYVQVPVNIVYHIPIIVGDIYIGAGPYGGFGVYGKAKLSADVSDNGSHSTFSNNAKIKFGNDVGDIRKTEYGAEAIAGIKLKFGLLLNLNYDLGLTNILPDGNGNKMRTRVLGLSTGFAF